MKNYNSKFKKSAFLIVVFIFAFSIFIFWLRGGDKTTADPVSFAECLTEKGAVMYGADWCPHCQNQKRMFGGAFSLVNYVECPDDPQRCLDAGIEGYPTWIFADGTKLTGEQKLETLAEKTGCLFKNEGSP